MKWPRHTLGSMLAEAYTDGTTFYSFPSSQAAALCRFALYKHPAWTPEFSCRLNGQTLSLSHQSPTPITKISPTPGRRQRPEAKE